MSCRSVRTNFLRGRAQIASIFLEEWRVKEKLRKAPPLPPPQRTPLLSINQFSGPAYPWGVAGAAAQVGASKHLDPLQQRIDALLGCQGETN